MALPININELLNGKTVEWERIEFREGWNPERTLRTICAFANDFNNWGGGYIVLGIAENNGQPVLPPKGLHLNQIDSIQQELNNICRKILPNYFPIVEPVDFQNKKILILWCPGGSNRPYKAPETLGNNPNNYYYIRRYSSTVKPNRNEERELLSMANQIPFDDQANHHYQLSDLDLTEIKTFLNEVNSDLEKEIPKLQLSEIARRMNIAEGADEYLLPKNIGLLFFAKEPQKVFPSAKIEIVTFEDEAGSSYTEKIFSGTLHRQLKSALDYLKNMVVKEKIVKNERRAEAERFFNYPYDALEEALCNSVYHRGYDNDSTIEIRIYHTKLDIISFPGPLPPLDKEKLKKNQFDVRKYRNRRIGEFLKELHLTEGRATGIPTIIKAMKMNNSPNPVFETDDDRSYFKTTLKINPKFLKVKKEEKIDRASTTQVPRKYHASTTQVPSNHPASTPQVPRKYLENNPQAVKALEYCYELRLRKEIQNYLGLLDREHFRKSILIPLIDNLLIKMLLPEKPNSPNQKYIITEKGKQLLKLLIDN
ncbi:MAG: putative DNA binding domain-containing protein [Ignavibacteriaceae bacterium]|nr:putative DNA binding domain-containing protein [Ignavibacteriaceae bacterium]